MTASGPAIINLLSDRLGKLWADILDPSQTADTSKRPPQDTAAQAAPVVWILGKVQSGKSSIVKTLTGATDAEVGSGYRPCTKTARIFDFPPDAPLIRFLDTRGIGEVAYDPSEDIAAAESHAHLLLLVMKVLDQRQDVIIDVLHEVRRRHPDWPVVVAQTCLHEAYPPNTDHSLPYPYTDAEHSPAQTLPPQLRRALDHQRSLFATIPGQGALTFVPIDFTKAGDGFAPVDYGKEALIEALEAHAPSALAASLRDLARALGHDPAVRAHPHIVGYALSAGAVDTLPVAGAVAVPGIQAKLLHSLGRIYGVEWNRNVLTEFAACLGSTVLTRLLAQFGIRQLVKLVPVYGQTVGSAAAAATSFATTFALGKAACYFLDKRRHGETDQAGVEQVYADALRAAFTMAKERDIGQTSEPKSDGQ